MNPEKEKPAAGRADDGQGWEPYTEVLLSTCPPRSGRRKYATFVPYECSTEVALKEIWLRYVETLDHGDILHGIDGEPIGRVLRTGHGWIEYANKDEWFLWCYDKTFHQHIRELRPQ